MNDQEIIEFLKQVKTAMEKNLLRSETKTELWVKADKLIKSLSTPKPPWD